MIESFVDNMMAYVRSVKAKGVTYKTGRNARAFARRLKAIGMKPALVEFFLEIDYAN